jgi:hypothetical protein
MRVLFVAAAAAFLSLSLSACSGFVITQSEPKPDPPHSVREPVASLGIPPGHFPKPGQCRLWYPGRPPGKQPRAVRCASLGKVPLGAWVLHRPRGEKRILEVKTYHDTKPEIVVSVGYYDATTGTLIRMSGSS